MNVPLLDLKAQFPPLRAEIMAEVHAVCDEQGFILGPRVMAFEESVARYIGSRYAIGCASGSDALLLSLMVMGVKAGDEVITIPFTFFAGGRDFTIGREAGVCGHSAGHVQHRSQSH